MVDANQPEGVNKSTNDDELEGTWYRSFVEMSEGKFGYFSDYGLPYIGGHILKFTPGDKTEISKLTFNHAVKESYPRMCATGHANCLRFLIHRAVLLLYGGPNNSLKPFSLSQELVGDHLEGDRQEFSAPMVQWILFLQNIEKEKKYV
jgi:hypothetical protein